MKSKHGRFIAFEIGQTDAFRRQEFMLQRLQTYSDDEVFITRWWGFLICKYGKSESVVLLAYS